MSRSTLIVFTVSILLIIAVGALMMNLFSENRMNESSSVISGLKINLPPDPGEVGKLTLQGVDSDEDGVRDDVQ